MLSTLFMELGCLASYGFLISLILFLLLLGTRAVQCFFLFKTFKAKGIPGPQPSLFSGNYFQLRGQGVLPHEVIGNWIEQYGKVFGYFEGSFPMLVVSDLEVLKEVMVRRANEFVERSPMSIPVWPLIDSVLYAKGDNWRRQRKILTPSFSSAKLKNMMPLMNQKVDILVEALKAHSESEVDICEDIQALTLDIIGACALAMDVNSQREPSTNKMLATVRDYFHFAVNPAVISAVFFPVLGYPLKFINDNLTAGHMTDLIVENLRHVIGLRRSDSSQRRVDMLQLMLDSDPPDEDSKKGLSDSEVIANAHIFMLAGFETTSTALSFTFYLLALHQDVQLTLSQEIEQNIGDKEDLSYEDLNALTYLDQVFNESLRYYPPVHLFQVRQSINDCEINGVCIPKGALVQAPIWQIHHDPQIWPEPDIFDPDRFSPENRSRIPSMGFLPFGTGPRNCIGMRFALMEAKLTIAKVVRKFRVQSCERTEIPLKLQSPTVILGPQNGILLRFVPRS